MPAYDYVCRSCDTRFEVRRSLTAVADVAGAPSPTTCPAGHDDITRVWSAVALGGRAPGAAPAAAGCCGGGCCS